MRLIVKKNLIQFFVPIYGSIMLKLFRRPVLYGGFGVLLGSMGYGLDTWGFWVLCAILIAVDVSSFLETIWYEN